MKDEDDGDKMFMDPSSKEKEERERGGGGGRPTISVIPKGE